MHCPWCDKYYAIVSVQHVCNRELKCTRQNDPPEITNITARAVDIDAKYIDTVCLECIDAEKRANAPTYNKCPGCGYQGWYKPTTDTLHCISCINSADEPVVAPAVAHPTAPVAKEPRKPRPIGTITYETFPASKFDPSGIELTFRGYPDTQNICSEPKISKTLDSMCYASSGFITPVLAAKKEIEDALPGIIWVDIPAALKMYLEDLAEDNGVVITF